MLSSSERDNLHLEVRRQLSDLHTEEATTEGPAPKKAAVDFEEWENVPVADATDKVKMYSTHNHAMQDDRDVLGWWRDQQLNYPKLSVLARGILAIPASSSSSERNFSAAGRAIEQRRTALKPSTVDAILFLHKNMDWPKL
ncbi:zinc finger BED domain-containing protein RICESLEEPER 1-like [Etheostoma cragini]|uniref:zinc finger BED domain-containing protein RICESLEEPER 1-like n=1 Tax=Etheostoma cragini TaxID=417921 RepID=UPI00155F1BC6|nr:zinc finger BED domain-containing protein RICESLEEPER 1-like [Etheostoma cragini]